MTAVGFTFMLGALTASDDSVVFTVGVLLSSLYFVVFAHMVLAYPDGRLERPWHARLLAVGYVLALVGPLPQLLWGFSPSMRVRRLPGVGAADRAATTRCATSSTRSRR